MVSKQPLTHLSLQFKACRSINSQTLLLNGEIFTVRVTECHCVNGQYQQIRPHTRNNTAKITVLRKAHSATLLLFNGTC